MSQSCIRRYIEEAVAFVPAQGSDAHVPRIRVARTLLTCRVAVAVLNQLRVPEEPATSYRYVNVHNPRCPLGFDPIERRWTCPAAFEEHPVWSINWAGAALLCEHLGGRLPRASEWECFASNNDPSTRYPWGDAAPSPLLANYDEHYGGTSPVGRFPPSEIGLYDLAGNLSEWCQDRHRGAPLERVAKGGAWSKDARYLAIAVDRGKWERLGTTTIGLRPVWDD